MEGTLVEEALWGFAGGILAWLITTLVFQPMVAFATLRSEIAVALSFHKNGLPLDAHSFDGLDEHEREFQRERLNNARRELCHLATRFMAFHQTELFAPKILKCPFSIDPQMAARSVSSARRRNWSWRRKTRIIGGHCGTA
ncbi:hypothetical protein AA309_22790 [Microvirga vignae]|uniref:Uncharacterized protein n=1 Tax=Microvirga vignae TaxID=1225564 RepID=A0A0H1R839_9HYPH|nr:hypothetical protein AA309_22790 [Microvirga vignae]